MCVKVGLTVVGFRRTARALRACSRRAYRLPNPSAELIQTTARHVVTAAALHPGRALCLEQSLTLYYCLRRIGIEAEFRMGAKLNPFSGHAWVEYDGRPVEEDPERFGGFVAFPNLPI
jgi:hypothetical protein